MPKGVYIRTEKAKKNIGLASKGRIPWNAGLTKETDERVARTIEKSTASIRRGFANGRIGTGTGKKYSQSKEVNQRRSLTLKRLNQNSEYKKEWREKLLRGENHPLWKGGISNEPYGEGWTEELRENIKRRDKHTCQLCWTQTKKKGKLAVHHCDFLKTNHSPSNLITLCISCHIKIHHCRNRNEKQAV